MGHYLWSWYATEASSKWLAQYSDPPAQTGYIQGQHALVVPLILERTRGGEICTYQLWVSYSTPTAIGLYNGGHAINWDRHT